MGGAAGIFELVCGALLVVGLFTRPAAFLLSGLSGAAYFMVHTGRGFFPLLNGGGLAVLYCFVFLYLSTAGGGPIGTGDRPAPRKQGRTGDVAEIAACCHIVPSEVAGALDGEVD